MVPDGWEHVRLDSIAKTVTSGSRDWAKYYSERGSKFIRMTNLTRDGIYLKLDDLKYVDVKSNSSDGKRTSLKAGDLLISITAELGKIGWVPEGLGVAYINQHTALVRLKENKSDSKFIAYLLSSKMMNHKINRLNDSGAKAGLNLTTIRSIPFELPPLPEQQKIAQTLSTWDKVISTTERLIDNSKQQKKALVQQLLTGKKRLLDVAGNPFEDGWKEVKLSEIAHITMGSSPRSVAYNEVNDGLPLLQGNADIKNRKSAPRIHTSEITKECCIGDILLSVRAPVGTVAISFHNACIGRGIAAIKSRANHCQNFLYQWLLAFEAKWERYSQGSTFEAVNSNDIKSLRIKIPGEAEQQKITSVLTNADNEIELLEQQLADLKQEKKALMQQLLTGKRRVKIKIEAA